MTIVKTEIILDYWNELTRPRGEDWDDSPTEILLQRKKLLDERLREAKENQKQIISEKEFNTRMKENFS